MMSEFPILIISPLNSLYCYNNCFNNNYEHKRIFVEMLEGVGIEFDLEQNVSNIMDSFQLNDEIIHIIKDKLKIVPYVMKEFLEKMKAIGIKINLLAENKEEQEIILFEIKLLDLEIFINDIYLKDKLTVPIKNSIIITDNVSDLKYGEIKIFNFLLFTDSLSYIKYQKENIIKLENNNKPHMIIESLRQANYIIEYFTKQIITETNVENFFHTSVNVLYIFDSKSSSKNYRKRELCLTTERICYIPFITKNYNPQEFKLYNNILLYKKTINVVLQRCPYLYFDNINKCNEIQSGIDQQLPNALLMHNMNIINQCFYRYNVYTLLSDFIKKIKNDMLIKYNMNIKVPYSFLYEINDISEIDEHVMDKRIENLIKNFKNQINAHDCIAYPILIKPDSCTEHQMHLILNEAGLSSFINKDTINKIIKQKTFIVQQFIPHGGIMFKNYFINEKTFTITRPSLPNLEGETLNKQHFQTGCFQFHNEFLYKKEDASFFDNESSNNIDNINYEALDYISKQFKHNEKITLFGLDYMFDQKDNSYYLLEINYFPSYRELGNKLSSEFADHIIYNYLNK